MTASAHFRPVTARLPVDVFDRLTELADQEQRSVSNLLRFIATRYLEDHQRDAPSAEQPGD